MIEECDEVWDVSGAAPSCECSRVVPMASGGAEAGCWLRSGDEVVGRSDMECGRIGGRDAARNRCLLKRERDAKEVCVLAWKMERQRLLFTHDSESYLDH